jgi:AcrR family transcriptional regulator
MNDTKTKILDAASDLFLEGGIQALSVRAISKQAGLSTIGIYSHFQGKQGILDALYIEGFQMVADAMDVFDLEQDPRKAVILATNRYLEIADLHEAHYRLIFGESNSGYSPSEEAQLVGAKAFARLTKVVSGILPNNATLTQKQSSAMEIWALVHGFSSLHHHAIAEMIEMTNWKLRVADAVEIMVNAIYQKHNS